LCVTLGHSHPDYVKALCAQAEKIIQVGTTFIAPSEVLLEKKSGDRPGPAAEIFFCLYRLRIE